jgi:parallel beta-helix repeat protein
MFGLLLLGLLSGAAMAAPVTPMAYGAAGNGTANDTTPLQNALNTGKIVHLEGGSYRITQRVNVPAGGGIVGPGTIIHDFNTSMPPAAPSSADVAILANGDNVSLSDFTIRKVVTDGSYSNGVVCDTRRGLRIHNLDISGYSARYGIHIVESQDFEVTGCHIHDFMVNTTCDMIGDSPAGLRITRCSRGVVSGNRVINIKVGPVGLASISPQVPSYGAQGYQSDNMTIMQSTNIAIVGNVCITSGEGIDMLLSNSCTLSGNQISDIWFQGVKMLGVSYCSLTGNYISDCFQGIGLTYHGTFLAEASGNTVSGNTLRNIGSPGSFGVAAASRVNYGGAGAAIDLHDADKCRYNVVSDNTILDTQTTKTTTAGVRNIGGATNLIADNIFTTAITQP